MNFPTLVGGILLTVLGILMTWKAYELTRLGEQLDSIGSKRRFSQVEPAEWNVKVTRRLGPFFALFGLWLASIGYGF